jgi:predicted enzyme related to lactoylglutathione lyase
MPDVNEHQEGMLSWADLGTTDLKSAKRFYSELFGWKLNEMPMDPEGKAVYVMAELRGRYVCGMAEQDPEQRKQGVPPHWMPYITVKDVDARSVKAQKAGGKALAGPFDVMDLGRMAVIQDPTGAALSLWQAKKHRGAAAMNEPGALSWVELMTTDAKKALAFWTQVLPWKPKTSPMDGGEYTELYVGDQATGGVMQIRPEMKGMPSHWGIYFAVADTDGTAKRAEKLGGKVHMPPTDIPKVGRFAVLADAQGAAFNIIKLDEKPR